MAFQSQTEVGDEKRADEPGWGPADGDGENSLRPLITAVRE
jgi:hypothetical protein